MIRRRYDRTIRLTQAELNRRGGAFPLTRGTQILVIGEDGEVRQSFGMAITDVWADPDDDEAELHWAVCIGIIALGEWAQRMWISSARRNYAECCMPHCTWPVEVPADMHGPHVCRDCATPDLPDFMDGDYSEWQITADDLEAMREENEP